MYSNYQEFLSYIKNKKILFYGLGKSNIPFIDMLTKEKINVTIYDDKKENYFSENLLKNFKNNSYIDLNLGNQNIWNDFFDIIIRSPGISFFSEKIKNSISKGSIVTSEIEIFLDVCPCPVIGITGSDGKTTISTIIYEILKKGKKRVYLGGNIGNPLLPLINQINYNDIAILELSSFQLMSLRKSPCISLVSNISPNHLDFHKDMQEYIDSKKQIILHQTAFSKSILNFNCSETRKFSTFVRGETIYFSSQEKVFNGVWIDKNNDIFYSKKDKNIFIMNASEIKVMGKHNLENFLAAIACTYDISSIENIKTVANTFTGVKHRIEFVKDINGVSYYNDSIASSPNRTIKGTLSLFDKKIILIAGGYDKNLPFDNLAKKILEKVSVLILMGTSANKIKNEIQNLNNYKKSNLKIFLVKNMEEAINKADENSSKSDIVVLSPACASFDLYKNFEERGNHFKSIVLNKTNL